MAALRNSYNREFDESTCQEFNADSTVNVYLWHINGRVWTFLDVPLTATLSTASLSGRAILNSGWNYSMENITE